MSVTLTPRQVEVLKLQASRGDRSFSADTVLRLIATIEMLAARVAREVSRI